MSNCKKCGKRIDDPLSEQGDLLDVGGDKLDVGGDKLDVGGDKLCMRCLNLYP